MNASSSVQLYLQNINNIYTQIQLKEAINLELHVALSPSPVLEVYSTTMRRTLLVEKWVSDCSIVVDLIFPTIFGFCLFSPLSHSTAWWPALYKHNNTIKYHKLDISKEQCVIFLIIFLIHYQKLSLTEEAKNMICTVDLRHRKIRVLRQHLSKVGASKGKT